MGRTRNPARLIIHDGHWAIRWFDALAPLYDSDGAPKCDPDGVPLFGKHRITRCSVYNADTKEDRHKLLDSFIIDERYRMTEAVARGYRTKPLAKSRAVREMYAAVRDAHETIQRAYEGVGPQNMDEVLEEWQKSVDRMLGITLGYIDKAQREPVRESARRCTVAPVESQPGLRVAEAAGFNVRTEYIERDQMERNMIARLPAADFGRACQEFEKRRTRDHNPAPVVFRARRALCAHTGCSAPLIATDPDPGNPDPVLDVHVADGDFPAVCDGRYKHPNGIRPDGTVYATTTIPEPDDDEPEPVPPVAPPAGITPAPPGITPATTTTNGDDE